MLLGGEMFLQVRDDTGYTAPGRVNYALRENLRQNSE